MTSSLFIRTIAGNRGLGCILSQQLLLNLLRKLCELRRILRIRSPSSKLSRNGMFCNGCNCRDYPESRMLRNVLQLYERVLKRAVSVDAHQNGPRSVAVNHVQSVDRHGRDSAGIRWHGDNSHVVLRHRDLVEIQPAIGQIDGNGILVQRSSHKARHLLRSTRRTKHNFKYAHLDTLPLRSATRQAVFTSSQSIRHVGSPFWRTKHPNAPTLRCLPLRFV